MDTYPLYPYLGSKTKCEEKPVAFPPQHQDIQPGLEYIMSPRPIYENPSYRGSNKLSGRVAVITGGDSGIGRATAVAFAKEGADVTIVYLYEDADAVETRRKIEQLGRRCLNLRLDLRSKAACCSAITKTMEFFGRLDILVNNVGVQYPQESLMDISEEQLEHTFRTNIFSFFFMTQAALPHLKAGDSIINTASVTAFRGEKTLIDYSSTKGAIVSFTRSLAMSLVEDGIRVNAVAPGPIWTPLTVSSFPAERVAVFGTDTPMKRAGQPFELAPAYVYLASDDSRYVTGETLHINGGAFIA
ncbi:SDR family oxidoreductase [Paenibacillus larvae]|uniref:Putative oxidoreductase YhdF n=1 Tax=Paenibacillus larvae subsp. larvae TaxID=147375 RepID=A0A2L1U0M3_9BACL|nr:SDR family oxidoreductase [Paenibacillus larvae]AQZ48462.1 NAD(P)-dependent oxidoreductase [Paenibacillus larvae subsp. pulvifaciens]AVF26475.1 putative oxidoreductase YhdF [Paenibacillus larvae subsp. larvae]AVF31251.1 putative oxidoreductase YhdF [Paenibacillus larvae subsp. larvae]MBH0341434.1 dehydrogenase [Paenibacillus larvae]MCY7521833.1 SDR family oxidoreductase [Paenibacillus larvae]